MKQSMQNLALAAKQLRGGLHQLVKQLLKKVLKRGGSAAGTAMQGSPLLCTQTAVWVLYRFLTAPCTALQDTRSAMVAWLAAALNSNLERCKMRPDPARTATDGFMLNLAGVGGSRRGLGLACAGGWGPLWYRRKVGAPRAPSDTGWGLGARSNCSSGTTAAPGGRCPHALPPPPWLPRCC